MRAGTAAIARAEPLRLMRTFLDEGGVIGTLFEKMADARLTADSGTVAMRRTAQRSAPRWRRRGARRGLRSGRHGLLGSLSRRELEVLRSRRCAYPIGEIGEDRITEGSVSGI